MPSLVCTVSCEVFLKNGCNKLQADQINAAGVDISSPMSRDTIRILVDSFADAGLPNAQMGNAREIVCRLDPHRFHVSMFVVGKPDPRIAGRRNTRLIQLPQRRQTVRILREFLWGPHQIVFYLKASPASRWYLRLRKNWNDGRTIVGTMESQSDMRNEPTVSTEAIHLWKQTVLCCDYLVSNSESVQRSLAHEYGKASQVIPTGVDTKFFTPNWEREPNPRPQVLFVGSLRPFKQPQLLLQAAARFPQADFRIAGDGPLASDLKNHIASQGLNNATLLGLLDAESLRREYREADIFLFPSAWEGSPKVILEAEACGLPVIVRCSYSPETVLHGATGYQAVSDEDIFSCLDLLLASSDLRQRLGRRGRQHATHYDWDKITARWSDAFERLAGRQELREAS
jgi:glycosyltransferase involved in cell wall biosynthesis